MIYGLKYICWVIDNGRVEAEFFIKEVLVFKILRGKRSILLFVNLWLLFVMILSVGSLMLDPHIM